MTRFRKQMTDYARGDRLRFLREKKRLTQIEAAYESGFSDRSIRSWEHDGKIKWAHAKKYAEFLGVEAESVVTRELRPPVEPEDIEEIKAQLAELTKQRSTGPPAGEPSHDEAEQESIRQTDDEPEHRKVG